MDDKIPDRSSIGRISLELSKFQDNNKEFKSEDDLKSFFYNIFLNKRTPQHSGK
jgi:hypothetical protein